MTTTASKQGLKAAATRRTAKHAQRTMLPPKATEAEREQNIAELVEESPSARYGMMTVAQLKVEAKSLGIITHLQRTKGALLNAILMRLREDKPAEARAEAKVDATFSGPQPGDEIVIQTQPAEAPEPEAPAGKSGAKATRFAGKAEALGWAVQLSDSQNDGDWARALASRDVKGGEAEGLDRIVIEWRDGVFIGDTCYHTTPAGRQLKLRNASECLRRMGMHPAQIVAEDAKAAAHSVGGRRSARPAASTTGGETRTQVFPDSMTDLQVLDTVVGKTIQWVNARSGGLETDTVKPGSGLSGITHHVERGRSLNFLGKSGYRSARVSAIVSVS